VGSWVGERRQGSRRQTHLGCERLQFPLFRSSDIMLSMNGDVCRSRSILYAAMHGVVRK
jgi:hypothetical protein